MTPMMRYWCFQFPSNDPFNLKIQFHEVECNITKLPNVSERKKTIIIFYTILLKINICTWIRRINYLIRPNLKFRRYICSYDGYGQQAVALSILLENLLSTRWTSRCAEFPSVAERERAHGRAHAADAHERSQNGLAWSLRTRYRVSARSHARSEF